jgi:hypothetical protein
MAPTHDALVEDSTEDAFLDAMDSIRLYSHSHPEWKRVYSGIIAHVEHLKGVPLREPGT